MFLNVCDCHCSVNVCLLCELMQYFTPLKLMENVYKRSEIKANVIEHKSDFKRILALHYNIFLVVV